MSEQKGMVKLKGNLGGISFYQSGGKHMARIANAPDKKRILSEPRFQRTRENNSEFGGCARVVKAFRQTFAPVISRAGARFTSRLTSIFKTINTRGEGIRGQRPFNLTENRVLLKNIDFNDQCRVTDLFTGTYEATHQADRTIGVITFDEVILDNAVLAPVEASHIVFTQVLGVVSNYYYDEKQHGYAPAEAALDGLRAVTDSDFIALDETAPFALTITTTLPGDVPLNEHISVVQCLGVSFYQLTRTGYRLLPACQAIKVVKVF